ncbi:putative quinol monooxygenase [Jatrophihabitans sp. DSM 45814]
MSLTAFLDLRLKSDSIDTAHQLLKDILVDTRNFPGCLGVQVLTDLADPAHIILVESWASEEDDAAYRAWRAGEGASNLASVLSGAPVLTRLSVESGI